jgi:HSP20 family protein
MLSVRGERKEEKEEKTRTVFRQERSFGLFERRVRLPAEVDRENVDAAYARGILKVTLPKKAGARSRTVSVKVKES